MMYLVVRTSFVRDRENRVVAPRLFRTLAAAKGHARMWKQIDHLGRRRLRIVYSVHKVCLVPDATETLWHI